MRVIKYLTRLQSSNIPHYLAEAFQSTTSNNLPWFGDLSANLPVITTDTSTTREYLQAVKSALTEQHLIKWTDTLWKDSNNPANSTKLRLYRLFKTSFRCEPYLSTMPSSHLRKALCRFRIGCHPLRIETARYQRPVPPPFERLCEQCTVECVENEIHFLTECAKFTDLREILYRQVAEIEPSFPLLPQFKKFLFLMSSCESCIIHSVSLFITQAEQSRTRLLTTCT